jgi:hypothetical protein
MSDDPLTIDIQQTLNPAALDALRAQYLRALYATGEAIMADSKENYCPVAPDGGVLRSSGHVLPPIRNAEGDLIVTLVYGGPADAYAIAVHEHLSRSSPYSWRIAEQRGDGVHFNVGGPKYLELPVIAARDRFTDDIGEHVRSQN